MFEPIRAAMIAAVFLTTPSMAAAQPALSETESEAAVSAMAQLIEDEFYDADRAARIAEALRAAADDGAFDGLSDPNALASALTERLVGEDRHFSVNYLGPEAVARRDARRERGPDAAPQGDPYEGLRRANFGFAKVEILPGNIGYIELNQFAPIAPAADTASAALAFLAGTDAVIFDLRGNGGGDPSMVQFLISHFVEPGGETLINTFVSRDFDYPNQLWSLASHPVGHRPDTPLVVLTSGRTGSAGEAFPYHLQALERATIIGKTTYGAGNPGRTFVTDEGFLIFISTSSARNPVTQSNWENVGVTPHIETPAAQALDRALLHLYGELEETTEDTNRLRGYAWGAELIAARLEPVALSAEALARYAGDWGMRDTWIEDGQLTYVREGGAPDRLIPLGEHRFAFAGTDNFRVVFTFEEGDGEAAVMELHTAGGQVVPNPRQGPGQAPGPR